ncbi:MAG: FUSC family protein [Rhodopila sp.]
MRAVRASCHPRCSSGGARNISWAAFSGYMVMRGHVADSVLRGALRLLGTVLGAGLALFVVPAVRSSWPMASLAAGRAAGRRHPIRLTLASTL